MKARILTLLSGSILSAQASAQRIDATFDDNLTLSGTGATTLTVTTSGDANSSLNIERTVNTPVTWSLYAPQGSTDLRFSNGTTDVGSVASAGNWALGASTLDVQNRAQGIGINTSPFAVYSTSTSGSSDPTPPFSIVKASANTGSVSTPQEYMKFFRNNAAALVGGIHDTGSGPQIYAPSDRRIKTDIRPLTGALNKLLQVKPSVFKLKGHENEADHVNYIAQELAEVFPQVVTKTDDGIGEDVPDGVQPWTVASGALEPYIVAAIKELNGKIQAQQAQIERMQKELDDMRRN